MGNARRGLMSFRCAWCSKVWAGKGWTQERRAQPEVYSHGICEGCGEIHFAGSRDFPLRAKARTSSRQDQA